MIAEADNVHRLACLEVRGGNHLSAYSAELPGLLGWVSCQPLQPSPRNWDIYYMSACSQGVIARVVLADVAGHGEAVSAAAGHLRDALRRHVNEWDQSSYRDPPPKRVRDWKVAKAWLLRELSRETGPG